MNELCKHQKQEIKITPNNHYQLPESNITENKARSGKQL